MFFVRGSKSTSVLCAGRKLLGFNLRVEIDLVFVRVVEIDFVRACWPEITWF